MVAACLRNNVKYLIKVVLAIHSDVCTHSNVTKNEAEGPT